MKQKKSFASWQNTIWLEHRYCDDEQYASKLAQLLPENIPSRNVIGGVTAIAAFLGALGIGLPNRLKRAGYKRENLEPNTWSGYFQKLFILVSVGMSLAIWLYVITWLENWFEILTNQYLEYFAPLIFLFYIGLMIAFSVSGIALSFTLSNRWIKFIKFIKFYTKLKKNLTPFETIVIIRNLPKLFQYLIREQRPNTFEIEAALKQACKTLPNAKGKWAKPLRRLKKSTAQPQPVDNLIRDLYRRGWINRFVARFTLANLGGEAVDALQSLLNDTEDPQLQQTAIWLLNSIEAETTSRLSKQTKQLLCCNCLVHCHPHKIYLSQGQSLTFYGCRVCRQSQRFIEWQGKVVATLNAEIAEQGSYQQNGFLRVNWLQRRSLFDFDLVEIIQATDEDVERFAVQVGNDTDEMRKPRYKQMRCTVSADCGLFESTIRLLRQIFGQVEIR